MISNVICNSAKQGLIPQREYFDKDIANSDNTNGYYIIESNDFVYNPRKSADAPYGPISSYQYPEAGIVSPLYLCFRAKREINPLYFEWYFRSSTWHRYIYMSGDSGARHDRVSIKDDVFFAMPINVPSAKEQERISLFLDAIERRIETQRTLVETLKKYKRGLLNKLFSNINSNEQRYFDFKLIRRPSITMLGGDSFISNSTWGNAQYHQIYPSSTTQGSTNVHARHSNMMNMMFADGHAGATHPRDYRKYLENGDSQYVNPNLMYYTQSRILKLVP